MLRPLPDCCLLYENVSFYTRDKFSCAHFFYPHPPKKKITIQLKAEDSERFKTMVQFECRGLEPVDFQPQVRANGTESVTIVYLIPNPKNIYFIIGMLYDRMK